MTRQLVQYLSARTGIDAQTTAYVTGHFKPMVTKRNAFLLTPGEVCKHYYFVNKGCLRLFSVNDAGEEGTCYFAFEGSFGTALPSLIDQQPAFEFIQTIEPSELLVIGRDDFFRLVDTVPPFARISAQRSGNIHAGKRN
jgi:CRP-like cAMP-binding protein